MESKDMLSSHYHWRREDDWNRRNLETDRIARGASSPVPPLETQKRKREGQEKRLISAVGEETTSLQVHAPLPLIW